MSEELIDRYCEASEAVASALAMGIPCNDDIKRRDEIRSELVAALGPRVSFRNGPVMAQVTYAEFLTWIADRLEHVHGENPDVDYMHRLRELAASVVPADAASPSSSEEVTPEMIAAGFRVLNAKRIRLGPGPCLKDAYIAMRAAAHKKTPGG